MSKISSLICNNEAKDLITAIAFLVFFIMFANNQMTHTSMSLNLCNETRCQEQDLAIDLSIDTNQFEIIAADSVIEYDSQKLDFIGIEDHQIFHSTLSRQLKKNLIELSCFQLPPNTYKGDKVIVTLYFKIKQDGDTLLTLRYRPKEVSDSNLISTLKDSDVLGYTNNLKLTLKKP